VTQKPSYNGLGNKLQLADLDGDGGKQFVSYDTDAPGFFEMDNNNEWQNFRVFKNLPNVNFKDSNARMLDLDGDGKAELVFSEEQYFLWFKNEGREGFSEFNKTAKPLEEEQGANIIFSDATQSVFLSNMSGSGLTDIVRIKNGEICYWPNLGYGRFGAKVTMDNAPVFDYQDAFNPAHLRLSDIDGSGTSDIIYLGKDKFCCWKNLSGNAFSTVPFEIDAFPEIHQQSKITVTDLLGNGVSCIVWSGSLSKDASAPLKYIDLMNSKKPHIMVFYKNNMGKEVSLEYKASTHFYIEDKLAGKPWVTKLHFPVHCLSGIATVDKISGTRFVSSYKYHHGYYDHAEREFRGFGMIEQTDAETYEAWKKSGTSNILEEDIHQEPVVSRSWYHTGAFLQNDDILNQFADDYWYNEMKRNGFTVTHPEVNLPPMRIVTGSDSDEIPVNKLSPQELCEAYRACKSMALRTETFAKDAIKFGNTPEAFKTELTPYTVATHNCVVELIQPKGKNKHAVFTVKESEAINYSYERKIADPRINHTLNIKLDEYGNVLESAAVVYPRLSPDASLPVETLAEQAKTIIIYTQNSFTNDVIADNDYRLRLASEVKTFELKGVKKTETEPYYSIADFSDILSDAKSDTALYHEVDRVEGIKPLKRLIEHSRTLYYNNNLNAALPLHQLESLACSFESYQLAYTPELITNIFETRVTPALMIEGKFIHSEGDINWWSRSGTAQYIKSPETITAAQDRFYTPLSYTDPFGAITKVKYYGNYFLFVEETEDALGNKSGVDLFNFRTLSPRRMRDSNGNLSEAISDELTIIKAIAVMGKGNEADELTGLTEITEAAETALVANFFNAASSDQLVTVSKSLLNRASSRFVYDVEAYMNTGQPVAIATIAREEHFKQNPNAAVQVSFEYSNGLGEVIMKKTQAEPGLAKKAVIKPDDTVIITEVDTSALTPKQLRWIGNGRTIKNKKGNPVKQYQPYFSVTHRYENTKELVETGVTSISYYDAMSRLIRTDIPDGTFSKVVFDSWLQKEHDANDTILESEWFINRVNHLIDTELIAQGKDPVKEKSAAEKAAKHANTPTIAHLDNLGKPILSISHDKNTSTGEDEFYRTIVDIDVEGNLRGVKDPRGNIVAEYKYDMLGNLVFQNSKDAGIRHLAINITGKPLRTWDGRNHEFQYFYDIKQRPVLSKVFDGEGPGMLNHIYNRVVYGEDLLLPDRSNEAALQSKNVLGQIIRHYDTGGLLETNEFDFKSNPLATTRRMFKKYKEVPDWTDTNLISDLEAQSFSFLTEMDAMGRILKQTAPDGSIITPSYNEAGLLNGERVKHPGQPDSDYLVDIDYNEKGLRSRIIYGNGVVTSFYYDEQTFRLKRLVSKRHNNEPLQDWRYTYDAVGNITHVEDKNIPVKFFDNTKIEGVSEYTYNALYRLVEAKGRENDAALSFGAKDNWNDSAFMHNMNSGDAMSVRNYTQSYQYDEVGNILKMRHQAPGNTWTRNYEYESDNNRLINTKIGADTFMYPYHPTHGFITKLPHLEEMGYDFKDQLVKTIKQRATDSIPETTYYQYDGQGKRIRKITENQAAADAAVTIKDERIYIEGYELYKKHTGTNAGLERVSLSLIDKGHRFVMVETRNNINDGTEKQLIRYQLHNHLKSSCLELDATARIIYYEEYHPYGSTAYQARSNDIRSAAKRYRYTGMERDEETGLNYHSARYYLPWLGRWLSPDPIGLNDGVNVFAYCKGNPVMANDTSGTQANEQMNFYELPIFRTEVTATYSSRGISADLRVRMTGVYRMWTGDYGSEVDVGHMGKPFVLLRAGEVSPVGPQLASANRSDGGGAVRAMAASIRASGGFAREDGIDTSLTGVASRGTRYTPRPLSPALRNPALVEIGSATSPPVRTPLIAFTPRPVSPAPPSAPPVLGQMSFPGIDDQLQLNFGRPASSAPRTPAAPVAPTISPQLTLDLEIPPAPRSSGRSSAPSGSVPPPSGGGGRGVGGALANGAAQVVPGVGEALMTTEALVPIAARAGLPRLMAAAASGARAPGPAVIGGVVGAPAGIVAEGMARDAGMGEGASTGIGLGTAVATGAGVAVLAVVAVATAPVSVPVLAGAALVGGLAAGFGYLSSRLMR
ncbi:MAG: insecticidal toxin complex protein, partial [Flavobacterium psychrophilum]